MKKLTFTKVSILLITFGCDYALSPVFCYGKQRQTLSYPKAPKGIDVAASQMTTASQNIVLKSVDKLLFTREHEWISIDGNIATVGISGFFSFSEDFDDVTLVELPKIGARFSRDEVFATVENVKVVSDIFAPVSGVVIKINDSLSDEPETLNWHCPCDSWLVQIKMNNFSEVKDLLSFRQYKSYLGKILDKKFRENVNCQKTCNFSNGNLDRITSAAKLSNCSPPARAACLIRDSTKTADRKRRTLENTKSAPSAKEFTSRELVEQKPKGSRPVLSASQLFNVELPRALASVPDKAKEIGAVYVFKITGEGGGEWTIDLKSDNPSIHKGIQPGANCTIQVEHNDFLDMLANPAKGMQLFMQGKLIVKGDPMLSMKLQKLFSLL